jgi:hypothetical protein
MGGVCDTYGGQKKCVRGFGGETEVEEAITKLWRRWEDDIKVDIKYIERVWTGLRGSGRWQVTGCCDSRVP